MIRGSGRSAVQVGGHYDTKLSGAMGMERTWSTRPWGSIARAAKVAQKPWPGDRAVREALPLPDMLVPASTALLAAAAAGLSFVESSAGLFAPVCAALSAMLAGAMLLDGREKSDLSRCESRNTAVDGPAEFEPEHPAQALLLRPDPALAKELAQAAALAQLTQRISHELRTPLNAVIGFSELMSKETFGPLGSQRYLNYASHIHECGQTLLKSAEDTLAITSALAAPAAKRDETATFNVASLVEEAQEAVRLRAVQECLQFDVLVAGDCDAVGDKRAMRQVLVNLLQDAVERCRWHGRIVIRGHQNRECIGLEISVEQAQGSVSTDSLPVCVARTLLELNGMSLDCEMRADRTWCAQMSFDRVCQRDFFG